MYDGLTRKQAQPQVLKRLPNLKTVDGEMAALDAMEADERMVEIKEVLCSKYGGSVEGALDALEIDISIPHDVSAFVAAMANLEIGKEDAEHMFDCVSSASPSSPCSPLDLNHIFPKSQNRRNSTQVDEEKSGAVTLEKLADYFENC